MKLRLGFILFLLLAGFGALVTIPGIAFAGSAKVNVCHFPPGNPENYHTITVGEKALPAHLAHGDLTGACNALCAEICDDGDACTVDDNEDCEEVGCPDAREPVDCDDGLLCTDDSCDPGSGCVNDPVVCNAPDLCTTSVCDPNDGTCLDTPTQCDQGQQCNPNNGECEESICQTDWTCGQPGGFPICGSGGVSDICLCDLDVHGNSWCWGNFYCDGAVACNSNSDCGPGFACVTTCCGQTCGPTCPNPSGVPADADQSENSSSEETAAGTN